jgi:hypothetical protein
MISLSARQIGQIQSGAGTHVEHAGNPDSNRLDGARRSDFVPERRRSLDHPPEHRIVALVTLGRDRPAGDDLSRLVDHRELDIGATQINANGAGLKHGWSPDGGF